MINPHGVSSFDDCHYFEPHEEDFTGCPFGDPNGVCEKCPYKKVYYCQECGSKKEYFHSHGCSANYTEYMNNVSKEGISYE